MKVTRTDPAAFAIEFESEAEVREEHRTNLSMGGLRLATPERVPLHTPLVVTLRGPFGAETSVKATVVAALPDGLALAIEGDAGALAELLLEKRVVERESAWDRMRSLSQTEKILLAVKADRSERAFLLQDNDPRVLLSVLRNPRITTEEVARVAKSPHLNHQLADVIVKTSQWMANPEVRLALVHNAKTPLTFALRILPTLPEAEVRAIARGGTSMALKTAALRLLQR